MYKFLRGQSCGVRSWQWKHWPRGTLNCEARFRETSRTVCHGDWTIWHSQQQWMRAPTHPHPHQCLLLSFLFLFFNPGPPTAHEVGSHRGFGKNVFSSFAQFSVGFPVLLLLSCKNSLWILNTRPLSDIWLTKILFHSMDYLQLPSISWCPLKHQSSSF